MAKVRYSNKAVEDLTSIWEYTFSEWSESQADEYYEMLISACNRLLYPYIISNRSYDEITNGLLGIKAGHHVILYMIMDNEDVMVIRILHEMMDIKMHLQTK